MADRTVVDQSNFLPNTSYLKMYLDEMRSQEALIQKIVEKKKAEERGVMGKAAGLKDAYLRLGGDGEQVPAVFKEEEVPAVKQEVPEAINNGSTDATDDAAGAPNNLHPPVARDGSQLKRKADSALEIHTPSKKIKDAATTRDTDELLGTTRIPPLPGGAIMQSALSVLYRGLEITPHQIRWIDLSAAQTPNQAIADVFGALSLLKEDVLSMLKEVLATPPDGYLSACFIRALRATYQDHELRSMGLGFGSFELPRLWKATIALGKELTVLKHTLYHWLLDLSRYTITATFMMAALLRLPAFQGGFDIDSPIDSASHMALWRAHVQMDFAIDKIHKSDGTLVGEDCWGRWFRAPRQSLAQGALGEAFSQLMAHRGRGCMEAFILHGKRAVDCWKEMVESDSTTRSSRFEKDLADNPRYSRLV